MLQLDALTQTQELLCPGHRHNLTHSQEDMPKGRSSSLSFVARNRLQATIATSCRRSCLGLDLQSCFASTPLLARFECPSGSTPSASRTRMWVHAAAAFTQCIWRRREFAYRVLLLPGDG